jgi:hypothetical protein
MGGQRKSETVVEIQRYLSTDITDIPDGYEKDKTRRGKNHSTSAFFALWW